MPVENNDVILERRKTIQVNKSLLKKIVGLLSVLCLAVVMAFGLVACGGKTIASTTINAQGHLIVTYSDNSTEDLGLVVGQNGVDNVGLKDGCTHAFVEHTVKYANCSEEGIVLKVCTLCKGQVIGTTAKDPKAHGSYEVELLKTPGPNGEEVSVPVLVYESFGTKGGNHKDATCFEPGESEIICGGCGEVLEKRHLDQLTHNYVDVEGAVLNGNKCINGTFTGKVCTLCKDVKDAVYDAPDKGRHTATADWIVIAAPTKDAAGEIKGVCAVCKTEQTMELPKLNSNDYDHYVPTCATIAAGGETQETYTYSIDTFSKTFKFAYEVKHTSSNGGSFAKNEKVEYSKIKNILDDLTWLNGVPGNCQEEGEATFKCKDCSETIRIYAKGGHAMVDIVDEAGEIIWTEATCQNNKYKQQACSISGCSEVVKVEVQGTKLEHEYEIVGEPEQGEDGLIVVLHCTNAGCTDEDINGTATLVEDSETEATCQAGATVKYYIEELDDEITVITSKKAGHKTVSGGEFNKDDKVAYNKIENILADLTWLNGAPGNCTVEGEATFKCKDCSETIRIYAMGDHVILAEPDKYEDGSLVTKAPTCTDKGYDAIYTCAACGKYSEVKPEDEVKENGHKWTAEVVDGKVKLSCSVCNTIIEGIIDRIDNTTDAPECGVDGTVIYYYYENQVDADAETNLKSVAVKAEALKHNIDDADEITFTMEINGVEVQCKAKKCKNCGKYYIYQPPVDELA